MKSSFLFIRICIFISILSLGTLIFFLLRAIYYPELSILLLLIVLLCHLITAQHKKTPTTLPQAYNPAPSPLVPAEVKKALAEALGGIVTIVSNKKTKLTASEKKLLISEKEHLLTIAHYFESLETMRTKGAVSLEHPHETTSLTETIVSIVETRRNTFLKKGIVLLYRSGELANEYIAIDQKHLRRILETLLKSIMERNIHGRATVSQSESPDAHTVSVTIKLSGKNSTDNMPPSGIGDTKYITLQRMLESYGGTISFNTKRPAEWTTCTCTFPSSH